MDETQKAAIADLNRALGEANARAEEQRRAAEAFHAQTRELAGRLEGQRRYGEELARLTAAAEDRAVSAEKQLRMLELQHKQLSGETAYWRGKAIELQARLDVARGEKIPPIWSWLRFWA